MEGEIVSVFLVTPLDPCAFAEQQELQLVSPAIKTFTKLAALPDELSKLTQLGSDAPSVLGYPPVLPSSAFNTRKSRSEVPQCIPVCSSKAKSTTSQDVLGVLVHGEFAVLFLFDEWPAFGWQSVA